MKKIKKLIKNNLLGFIIGGIIFGGIGVYAGSIAASSIDYTDTYGIGATKVQDAIDKCEEGDTIKLLKSVSEDLVIPTGGYVTLDLNKHSITTKLINSGTFNVFLK